MKNKDLLRLHRGIAGVAGLAGVKFAYAMSKNEEMLLSELKPLEAALKVDDKLVEYEAKDREILEKYAKKDKDGKAVFTEDKKRGLLNYDIDDKNRGKLKVDREKLQKEYKDTIDKREKQVKEYNELLEADNAFTPFKVKTENVSEAITVGQLKAIKELIEQ